jgi:hypothetical protein
MKRAARIAALFQLKKTLKSVSFNSILCPRLSIYFKNMPSFRFHLNWNITSGYPANVIADNGILDKKMHFIKKPFSINKIAAKVREIIDKRTQREIYDFENIKSN